MLLLYGSAPICHLHGGQIQRNACIINVHLRRHKTISYFVLLILSLCRHFAFAALSRCTIDYITGCTEIFKNLHI